MWVKIIRIFPGFMHYETDIEILEPGESERVVGKWMKDPSGARYFGNQSIWSDGIGPKFSGTEPPKYPGSC